MRSIIIILLISIAAGNQNAFVEEFKRLTIENEKLKQKIENININKYLDILSEFKNHIFISDIISLLEFKKTTEFIEFKNDFLNYGLNYMEHNSVPPRGLMWQMGTPESDIKKQQDHIDYAKKYNHILSKYKFLNIDIKSLIYNHKSWYYHEEPAKLIFNIYNFMFDVDIIKLCKK